MTYQDTVAYLYSRLPYFSRDGKSAIKNDLNNTIALCKALGDPQQQFKSIHVGGTNGKGSTSNLLSAVFQKHGYRTGLYTSPHLKDFRERIRINGSMIPENYVVQFVERIKPLIETIEPSFFELTVALAFAYFAEEQVDIAIIEVGLGGRLDSTNVIMPELSIITNIGWDHADLLGDTLPKIAAEKAGIIKPHIPVVIGESSEETDAVFKDKAMACGSPIFFADRNVCYYNTEFESELKGIYQQKNITTVMQALDVLKSKGYAFSTFKIADALMHVKSLTGFAGRWEVLQESGPKVVADTGHNEHGLRLVVQQLLSESYDRLHMVIGMVKDKDRSRILELLPKEAVYYFCKPDLFRALDSEVLQQDAQAYGLKGKCYSSVAAAVNAARAVAGINDLIFIGGSTFVVAETI